MANKSTIKWLVRPEPHDYPAALSYLRLFQNDRLAGLNVARLKRAPMSAFKAKDIFRASGLSLLGVSSSHVEKDLKKIKAGTALSPLLLLRDGANSRVIIADGYHRLCAVYARDEDALIPCRIA